MNGALPARAPGPQAAQLVSDIVPAIFTAVLDRLDLTAVVLGRVDVDCVVATVDLDAIATCLDIGAVVHRLDLAAPAPQVIDDVDVPEIIGESVAPWLRRPCPANRSVQDVVLSPSAVYDWASHPDTVVVPADPP